MRPNQGPLDEVLASGSGRPPPPPGGGRVRRGGRRSGDPDAPMEVEGGGGDDPPPPGASKRRQSGGEDRDALTVRGGGPPPPPGPHGELIATNAAIVQAINTLSRQHEELTQNALLLEEGRRTAEATRAVREAQHREETAAMFREGLGGVREAVAFAAASAQQAQQQAQQAQQQSNDLAHQFLPCASNLR